MIRQHASSTRRRVDSAHLVKCLDELCGQRGPITCLTFSDSKIVTGGADNRVLIFSIASANQRITLRAKMVKEEEYCVKMNAYCAMIDAKMIKKKPKKDLSPDLERRR